MDQPDPERRKRTRRNSPTTTHPRLPTAPPMTGHNYTEGKRWASLLGLVLSAELKINAVWILQLCWCHDPPPMEKQKRWANTAALVDLQDSRPGHSGERPVGAANKPTPRPCAKPLPPPCPPGPLSCQWSIGTGHTYGGAKGAQKNCFHSPGPRGTPPCPGAGAWMGGTPPLGCGRLQQPLHW